MDPLGTITKYYPFVDSGTRAVLQSTMDGAPSFGQFVQRLSEIVKGQEGLTVLAHIAAVLARLEANRRISNGIEEMYGTEPIVKPWTAFSNRQDARYPDVLSQAINELMNMEAEPWIRMELYLLHARNFVYRPESTDSLDAAKGLLEQHPELECFAPQLLMTQSTQIRHEGDLKEAFVLVEQGLELARKHGDTYFECSLLLDKASMFRSNLQEAMELTEYVYETVERLGITSLLADTLVRMGFTAYRLGEYDLAVKSLIEAIEVYESLGESRTHYPSDISEIYSDLGNGENALEWARYALTMEPRYPGGLADHICPHVAYARASILQGQMKDALLHIEKARDIAHRSGLDRQLAQYYVAAGEYEIAVGNTLYGMQMVEDAFDIFSELGASSVTQCLLILTSAEIDLVSPSSGAGTTDSGLWMLRLEDHARKNNLTGIMMQHALLKARLQRKLGMLDQSRETLQAALELCDSPRVKSLRSRIIDIIESSTQSKDRASS